MANETVGEILDRARRFHRELGEFYQQVEDLTEKERVKLVLEYLQRHEIYLDESLAEYEKDASKSVLGTWFKSTPELELGNCFEDAEIKPDMSVADVLQLAIRFDNRVIELYKTLAKRSVSKDVRHLFKTLLEMEKKEEHQIVRNTIEMLDL